ncbi:MAG: hypothetical protein AAFQ87_07265, partial [Bacteroidota bacterium]
KAIYYLFSSLLLLSLFSRAQAQDKSYPNESSEQHPFGQAHPEAPPQIKDWQALIGECDCESISRKQDQTWAEPVPMIWRFKYIMDGKAIQDETLKEDGAHSGSIRQYNPDSAAWYVHYYSSSAASNRLSSWKGGKQANGDIVLYMPQKAPNGMDGFYKITFSEISEAGFKWQGAWVSPDESFVLPTWKINCTKRQ